MNKLREKFGNEINISGVDLLPEQCEQITDDFSVKFAMWLVKGTDEKTYIELQQYFKDNIYGKE